MLKIKGREWQPVTGPRVYHRRYLLHRTGILHRTIPFPYAERTIPGKEVNKNPAQSLVNRNKYLLSLRGRPYYHYYLKVLGAIRYLPGAGKYYIRGTEEEKKETSRIIPQINYRIVLNTFFRNTAAVALNS